jgi:hypothetical protein
MNYYEQITDHEKIAAVFLYIKSNGLHYDLTDLDDHKSCVKDILNINPPSLLEHFRIERPRTFDKIESMNTSLNEYIADLEYLFSYVTVSNFLILIGQMQSEIRGSKILDVIPIAQNAIQTTLDLFEYALTSCEKLYLTRDSFKRNIVLYSEPFFDKNIQQSLPIPESIYRIKRLGTRLLIKSLPLKPEPANCIN